MHCADHTAAFHSVCSLVFNCCAQYDPDHVYEWRVSNEPQA